MKKNLYIYTYKSESSVESVSKEDKSESVVVLSILISESLKKYFLFDFTFEYL